MRKTLYLLCALLLASSVHAHHSRAPFLLDEEVRVKGRVTKVLWKNPHPYYTIESVNASGVD